MKKILLTIVLTTIIATTVFLGTPQSTSAQVSKVANSASTVCPWYDASVWIYGPNYPTAEVSVQLCQNGSNIWQNSGVNCKITQFTGSVETTWCGVYNNGGSFVEPGVNFTEHYPWGGNFPNCYMRFHVNANSVSIARKWGGC